MPHLYDTLYKTRDLNAPDNPLHNIQGQKNVIFLRPDQIKLSHAPKAQNQNAVIRIATTIKKYGVIEPLFVRKIEKGSSFYYEVAENEAYWHALLLAGVEQIPCVISKESRNTRHVEDIFAQIEQKQLHIFDQALAFRTLLEEYSLTQAEIAQKLGISQSAVANKLRLLQLDEDEQREILCKGLSERHARALLRLKSKDFREKAMKIMCREQMTVAEAENLVEQMLCGASHDYAEQDYAPDDEYPPFRNHFSSFTVREPSPSGFLPRKFALQSLQPLYNSVDNALSIFRKTGYHAEMCCEESLDEVRITIKIPVKPI